MRLACCTNQPRPPCKCLGAPPCCARRSALPSCATTTCMPPFKCEGLWCPPTCAQVRAAVVRGENLHAPLDLRAAMQAQHLDVGGA